jgi:GNAT superfamily N-acetyltransferase
MPLVITHYEGIDGTPCVALAMRGMAELLADGGGEQFVGLHHSYNGITATIGDNVVGVLIWFDQPTSHRIWLQLGYVLPPYRGQGVYDALWDALLDKARGLKRPRIDSAARLDNYVMRAVAKKQGRVEHAVLLKYEVEP